MMNKLAKYYVVASQGILSMILLGVGGFFLGFLIDKVNYIYAIIFCLLGVFSGIYLLIRLINNISDNNERGDDNE